MTVELAYKAQGAAAATPVVILHGLFGSSTNWRSIARRLAERYRVFTVDLPNHGDSPNVGHTDYPSMAADVRAFLDERGIDHAALVGHSMGGKVAMRLALDTPERVSHLVVVDIAPVPSRGDHLPVIEAMSSVDLARARTRADVDRALAADIADSGVRMFLLQNLAGDADGYRWRIDLEGIAESMTDLLDFPAGEPGEAYRGPTLLLRGERSDYVGEADGPAIRRLFPNAAIETMPDAGHWLHVEQPDRLVAALHAHLAAASER